MGLQPITRTRDRSTPGQRRIERWRRQYIDGEIDVETFELGLPDLIVNEDSRYLLRSAPWPPPRPFGPPAFVPAQSG